jgi:Carboxypeptidase regulatory-like domain
MAGRINLGTVLALLLCLAAIPTQSALALITGGVGNKPIGDPGWPKGAAVLFNVESRVAWWEGPPFGGGQWHAECRGDSKAFNRVLADFAKLDVKSKKLVVHDGIAHSFWLAPNREPEKLDAAKVDWVFVVWQPANWERLRKMPADLNPTDSQDAGQGPPSAIDVYTGGNIRWAEVKVPKGIEVVDEQLASHGFTPADGVVLEGTVTELGTKKPIATSAMRLQRIEPQAKGGYDYHLVAKASADQNGRWVLKNASAGWYRVIVEANGFVPRVAGYAQFDEQPRWLSYTCGLARPAPLRGRVIDPAGQPLADVDVRLGDVVSNSGGGYESLFEYSFKTDAEGRFSTDQLPAGRATVWVHKAGYCRPGLGLKITTPKTDVELTMTRSGRIRVTVDFGAKERPGGYIVRLAPEGGERIGSYGGSGNIDAKNQITFEDVPPGRYELVGQPNPSTGNQQTKPLLIDLKGGQTAEITVNAR